MKKIAAPAAAAGALKRSAPADAAADRGEEEDLELRGAGGGRTDASGAQATSVAPAAESSRAGRGVPGSREDDEEVRRMPRRGDSALGALLPRSSSSAAAKAEEDAAAALASALGGGHRRTSSHALSSPWTPELK